MLRGYIRSLLLLTLLVGAPAYSASYLSSIKNFFWSPQAKFSSCLKIGGAVAALLGTNALINWIKSSIQEQQKKAREEQQKKARLSYPTSVEQAIENLMQLFEEERQQILRFPRNSTHIPTIVGSWIKDIHFEGAGLEPDILHVVNHYKKNYCNFKPSANQKNRHIFLYNLAYRCGLMMGALESTKIDIGSGKYDEIFSMIAQALQQGNSKLLDLKNKLPLLKRVKLKLVNTKTPMETSVLKMCDYINKGQNDGFAWKLLAEIALAHGALHAMVKRYKAELKKSPQDQHGLQQHDEAEKKGQAEESGDQEISEMAKFLAQRANERAQHAAPLNDPFANTGLRQLFNPTRRAPVSAEDEEI